MSSEDTDVTGTCNRLEEVHRQLRVIQEHNAEILEHLSAVHKIATESGITLPSQMTESMSTAIHFSEKVNNAVEGQYDTLHHSYRELKRLPGAISQSSDEGLNKLGQMTSALNDDVYPQREKSETELNLAKQMELIEVPKGSKERLEEQLHSVKDTMVELMETYRENTVKAEEELERVRSNLEAVKARVSGSEHMLDLSIDDSEASSPTASPIHATALPITSDIDARYLSLLEENRRQEALIMRLTEGNWYLIRKSQQTTADVYRIQKHTVSRNTHLEGIEGGSLGEEEMWFGN